MGLTRHVMFTKTATVKTSAALRYWYNIPLIDRHRLLDLSSASSDIRSIEQWKLFLKRWNRHPQMVVPPTTRRIKRRSSKQRRRVQEKNDQSIPQTRTECTTWWGILVAVVARWMIYEMSWRIHDVWSGSQGRLNIIEYYYVAFLAAPAKNTPQTSRLNDIGSLWVRDGCNEVIMLSVLLSTISLYSQCIHCTSNTT